MNSRKRLLLKVALPLTAAWAVLQLEPYLAGLAHSRPGLLLAAMCALVVCILVARARRALIITVCFAVGLIATRDAFGPIRLPAALDYRAMELIYPSVWFAIAALAFGAGLAEAHRTSSIWARRCYFAAAALYLLGRGTLSFIREPGLEPAMLTISGLFAVTGVLLAHRIVARERIEDPVEEDLLAMREARVARSAAVAAKEWREPPDHATTTGQAGVR
ncbi:MAG TPA: hypothetical protein VLH79_04465 [Chthonomonadales bacterium]|nr:hypothetical protein [Chthonomonadales bacterium]